MNDSLKYESNVFKLWLIDSANARKFKAALGISILLDNPMGFPWSLDSAVANSSKLLSIRSANFRRILDLVLTGVFDHLKHSPTNISYIKIIFYCRTKMLQLTKEMHSWPPILRRWHGPYHYLVFWPRLHQSTGRNCLNILPLQQIDPRWSFRPAQLNSPAFFAACFLHLLAAETYPLRLKRFSW